MPNPIESGNVWAIDQFETPVGIKTETLQLFMELKRRKRHAKMVCIDLTPNTSVQSGSESSEVLNVGGFTDNVFEVMSNFVSDGWSPDYWVRDIEKIEL